MSRESFFTSPADAGMPNRTVESIKDAYKQRANTYSDIRVDESPEVDSAENTVEYLESCSYPLNQQQPITVNASPYTNSSAKIPVMAIQSSVRNQITTDSANSDSSCGSHGFVMNRYLPEPRLTSEELQPDTPKNRKRSGGIEWATPKNSPPDERNTRVECADDLCDVEMTSPPGSRSGLSNFPLGRNIRNVDQRVKLPEPSESVRFSPESLKSPVSENFNPSHASPTEKHVVERWRNSKPDYLVDLRHPAGSTNSYSIPQTFAGHEFGPPSPDLCASRVSNDVPMFSPRSPEDMKLLHASRSYETQLEIYFGFIGIQIVFIYASFVFASYAGGILSLFGLITALYSHLDRRCSSYILTSLTFTVSIVVLLISVTGGIHGFGPYRDDSTLRAISIGNIPLGLLFIILNLTLAHRHYYGATNCVPSGANHSRSVT